MSSLSLLDHLHYVSSWFVQPCLFLSHHFCHHHPPINILVSYLPSLFRSMLHLHTWQNDPALNMNPADNNPVFLLTELVWDWLDEIFSLTSPKSWMEEVHTLLQLPAVANPQPKGLWGYAGGSGEESFGCQGAANLGWAWQSVLPAACPPADLLLELIWEWLSAATTIISPWVYLVGTETLCYLLPRLHPSSTHWILQVWRWRRRGYTEPANSQHSGISMPCQYLPDLASQCKPLSDWSEPEDEEK